MGSTLLLVTSPSPFTCETLKILMMSLGPYVVLYGVWFRYNIHFAYSFHGDIFVCCSVLLDYFLNDRNVFSAFVLAIIRICISIVPWSR